MVKKFKKNSRKWTLIACCMASLYSCNSANTASEATTVTSPDQVVKANAILPIKQVAGLSRKQVEQVLGRGAFASNWKDSRAGCVACPKYTYKGDSVEVIYIKGKADRITLNGLANYDFAYGVVQGLGLSPKEPVFFDGNVMRWYDYEGLKEIMAFNNGGGKVDYMLIKTKAE